MSPEVWNDAVPRITAAAASAGLIVAWPNEQFTLPEPPAMWLDIDVSAQVSAPIELGGRLWREEGSLWLYVLAPVGTGVVPALTARKAMSVAFRQIISAQAGLVWLWDHQMDSGQPGTDDGAYRRYPLTIRYKYEDILS